MIGRLLCFLGFHKLTSTEVPHTYRCARDRKKRMNGVTIWYQCHGVDAGHP